MKSSILCIVVGFLTLTMSFRTTTGKNIWCQIRKLIRSVNFTFVSNPFSREWFVKKPIHFSCILGCRWVLLEVKFFIIIQFIDHGYNSVLQHIKIIILVDYCFKEHWTDHALNAYVLVLMPAYTITPVVD